MLCLFWSKEKHFLVDKIKGFDILFFPHMNVKYILFSLINKSTYSILHQYEQINNKTKSLTKRLNKEKQQII